MATKPKYRGKLNYIKQNRMFQNITLLVSAFILFFLMGEIFLRLFFSSMINSEYGHGPGAANFMKDINYNSWGYRDVEHTISKPNDTFRVVIMGDSFTFGHGIKNPEDVYSRLLQEKLDRRYGYGNFEVINLAKGGYSTIDEVRILNDLALNLSPDVLVLGYYINDAEGPGSRVGFEEIYAPTCLLPWKLGSMLYSRSYMYYFIESRIKDLCTNPKVKDYHNHLYSDSNPFFKQHKILLGQFILTAGDNRIRVVVLNIPALQDFESYDFYFVNDYIENITASNNAAYIDLLPYFSVYDEDELRVSFMDGHMNELGHNITSGVLFDFLNDRIINEVKH